MTAQNTKKTKRSTDEMISGAVDRQQSWLNNRRIFTRQFLRRFNVFHRKPDESRNQQNNAKVAKNQSVLRDYWFPILCAMLVVIIAIVVITVKINAPVKVFVPTVPEPIIKPVNIEQRATDKVATVTEPSFDIVRIEQDGKIVIAGRNCAESNISVVVNNKVVATEHTDKNGEFVYAPHNVLKSGNYEIYLIDADKNVKSKDSVFVYVPEKDYKNSLSLLMTENGSKVLQFPQSVSGDLVISKIDYLNTGRIVVTGRALPKLRVSLTLNNKYLGYARVSNYKNFGLGADVGELKSGEKYKLIIRLHDASGKTIATKKHEFVMPKATGCEDTFYTVRRGDSLWIIANNFLRRGILFSIIADCNNITNPDLIYPKQVLHIPVK